MATNRYASFCCRSFRFFVVSITVGGFQHCFNILFCMRIFAVRSDLEQDHRSNSHHSRSDQVSLCRIKAHQYISNSVLFSWANRTLTQNGSNGPLLARGYRHAFNLHLELLFVLESFIFSPKTELLNNLYTVAENLFKVNRIVLCALSRSVALSPIQPVRSAGIEPAFHPSEGCVLSIIRRALDVFILTHRLVTGRARISSFGGKYPIHSMMRA